MYNKHINKSSRYYGHHWVVTLKNYAYHGLVLAGISFDIVDQTGYTYGRYQTFKQTKHLNGLDNVENTVGKINTYNKIKKDISVPIYPFPMRVVYYGFTINAIHIDLHQILENDVFGPGVIDYNWR
eukprot:308086_1